MSFFLLDMLCSSTRNGLYQQTFVPQVAFDDLGLGEIVAFTLPTNVASRRVMDKSGFTFERKIEHAGLPHVLYRRARDPSAGPIATLP